MDNGAKLKLLHSRAGFGWGLTESKSKKRVADVVKGWLTAPPPAPIVNLTEEQWLAYNPKTLKEKIQDPEKRREMAKEFRQHKTELNHLWMAEMVRTTNPLQEKMALFWHGHFATRIGNPYFDQKLLNTIRQHATSDFGTLLKAVSKSAAMLQFLNNARNKKEHPNENFAREVMELFTLGRGHYTETDVQEAARAFTGWSYDEFGDFVFRQRWHDTEPKTFLGKTGWFNGDDILDMLLKQKQTAYFIASRIYRFFVTDEDADEHIVAGLAAKFYESGYDVKQLLTEIFTSNWLYKEQMVGAKIKSPVELLVGYQRLLPLTFNDDKLLTRMQRVMGQYLFEPPNVAGWPGGKRWIDSSSLLVRMRLPEALLADKDLNLTAKEPDPEMGGGGMNAYNDRRNRPGNSKVTADWTNYLAFWKQTPEAELPEALAQYLCAVDIGEDQLKQLSAFADKTDTERYIKSLTILLMALPEYQLA